MKATLKLSTIESDDELDVVTKMQGIIRSKDLRAEDAPLITTARYGRDAGTWRLRERNLKLRGKNYIINYKENELEFGWVNSKIQAMFERKKPKSRLISKKENTDLKI